jgi:UDP:flavonoid glycosyltransferase YjiC (YdhE family)
MLQIGAGSWAACQGTDAILCTGIGFIFGPHIAERLNVPVIATSLQPDNPTRAFPILTSSAQRNFGSIFNLLTWFINDVMRWLFFRTCINQWRQEQLNLPSIPRRTIYPRHLRRQRKPLVYGFSPIVVPKPLDWGDHIEIAGYWFLDDSGEWQPPAALADFLAAGPAPVYIGFGSMSTRKQEETTDLVLRALARTGQRGLLVTGWGGLGQTDLPDNIFSVESAPHDWLFPQMAAVVHHGGAGTTAAGLRAGIPSIIVPFWEDQPFWGRRVASLGVGPPPIPRQKLTVERLAAAITTAVTDKGIRERAAAIGENIRAEDGVARAVEAISRYLPVR